MSGHSSSDICPNCGNEADFYTDWKPFSYSSYTCMHCGLMIYPKIECMTLDELNELRKENELDPLSELPKQEFETDAHNESRYFLFGKEACRIYDEENGNIDAEYFKKRWIGYSVYEYKGDPVDMLSQSNGWDDFCEITKQEYESLKK